MVSVEIFLPLTAKNGKRFPNEKFEQVKKELTEKFGGVTAFTRSPAEGRWAQGAEVENELIVIFEAMAPDLDRAWWRGYVSELERRFEQDVILARATEIHKL